jgi:hypothetical protein
MEFDTFNINISHGIPMGGSPLAAFYQKIGNPQPLAITRKSISLAERISP